MPRRGPRLKVIRRLGTLLPGLARKEADRKAYPPGQHGPAGARRKKSDFRRRFEEKQKVRFHYGVSETQLRRYFAMALRRPVATGEALLSILERRLDNVIFRLGLAPTIPAARQLVSHGHVLVNGRRVNRYLALDPADKFTARVISTPARADVPFLVDEAGIVEFYAR